MSGLVRSGFQKTRYQEARGFTLLEFLVAIMILSVGLLGMGTLTAAMIGYNEAAYNRTKATALAEDRMEELRNMSYQTLTGITSDTDTESIFTITTTVSPDTPNTSLDNLATITVTVTWNWKGDSKQVELKSIVGS